MPINWIVALKAVPWADVVQAAPHIVKGARKLFTTVRGETGAAATSTAAAGRSGENRSGVVPRLTEVEAALDALRAEQRASAELIRSLAEQQAKMIEAIEILRARARILFALSGVLSVALLVVAVWLVSR